MTGCGRHRTGCFGRSICRSGHFRRHSVVAAFRPITDICGAQCVVREGPKAAVQNAAFDGRLAGGCPTSALAAETGVKRQIERLSRIAFGESEAQKRQAAIGSWATMVGAMILARVSDDPALSSEILEQTKSWLTEQAKNAAARFPGPTVRAEATGNAAQCIVRAAQEFRSLRRSRLKVRIP